MRSQGTRSQARATNENQGLALGHLLNACPTRVAKASRWRVKSRQPCL